MSGKKMKITVSFRIDPEHRERITTIGHNSFSRGVETLLSNYIPSSEPLLDELGSKITDLEVYVQTVSDKRLRAIMLKKVEKYKLDHAELKVKNLHKKCKDIELTIKASHAE
jgi:hypothetical protein